MADHHDEAVANIQVLIRSLVADMPALEAIGVVFLWKDADLYDEAPTALVQGADGPVTSPDQLLRLHLATLELEHFLVEQSARGVDAVRALLNNLAREVMEARRVARTESQATSEGQATRDAGDHEDPLAHEP